ncbi:MAG: peptide chain release factor N(5)-glutamine methyltransferase [Ruminococcus sp.]|nr:peptide chain release factor N(5)-glutamine methyltransferase [Ruminococcus sp.]
MTLREAYNRCRAGLAENGFDSPELEAMALVDKAVGCDRLRLISHGNDELSDSEAALVEELLQRRLAHVPLQYITGSWSFCGFEFSVGEGVLIPRDDTEVVVGLCLDFLRDKPSARVVDLCAGSGAISVALSKLGNAEVTAVELSEEAFKFLLKNIKINDAQVTPLNDDIFTCHSRFADRSLDLIVSNPPYIKREELESLQEEVRFEPRLALDGGESGYDFYEAIIRDWSGKLRHGGALAFELGEGQAQRVSELMRQKGFSDIRIENDLGGIQRAIIGTMLYK